MDLIITAIEFSQLRDISEKLNESKINEAIGLAQQSDLIRILGGFFFDVLKNKEVAEWADLMNGSEFIYNSYEYQHQGIKALLADYTYGRYVYMINANHTPFGLQKKITQDSEGVDRNTIKDLAKQAQVDAGIKFEYIEKYLLSDPVLFSRYCEEKKPKLNFNSQRFSRL